MVFRGLLVLLELLQSRLWLGGPTAWFRFRVSNASFTSYESDAFVAGQFSQLTLAIASKAAPTRWLYRGEQQNRISKGYVLKENCRREFKFGLIYYRTTVVIVPLTVAALPGALLSIETVLETGHAVRCR